MTEQIEQHYLPGTLRDAQAVRRAVQLLVATGCCRGAEPARAAAYADQVTGWLVGLVAAPDVDDGSRRSPHTIAKYRRILARLEQRAHAAQRPKLQQLHQLLVPVVRELELLARLELERTTVEV